MNHPAGGLGMAETSAQPESKKNGGNGHSNGGNGNSNGGNGHVNGGNGHSNGGNGYSNGGNGHVNGGNGHVNGGNGHVNGGKGHVNGSNGIGALKINGSVSPLNGKSHGLPPSVVGYSANIGRNPFTFIGDFVYQVQRRDEKMDVVQEIVSRCLLAYRSQGRGDPQRLVLYRNGCSDGQFALVLKYEIPLIKHALEKLNCRPRITVIVPNKMQGIRFFSKMINPADKPPQQNLRPGTVIDTGVVHPTFSEFYLNSHRALQGTARTPRYTVLYDESNMNLDQLEGMTHHLCFGHQIVNSPTSLCTPVMVALEYAKRGHNLYKQFLADASSSVQRHRRANYTYQELTDELSFRGVDHLAQRRINA